MPPSPVLDVLGAAIADGERRIGRLALLVDELEAARRWHEARQARQLARLIRRQLATFRQARRRMLDAKASKAEAA